MQSNTYFKKVYNDLKKAELKKFAKTNAPMSFADLKILEYWVRIIDENPDGLNKASAFQLMGRACREKIVKGFIDIFNPFITPKKKPVKPARKQASIDREFADDDIPFLDDFVDDVDEDECELDTQYCNGRLLRQICRYRFRCIGRKNERLVSEVFPDLFRPEVLDFK